MIQYDTQTDTGDTQSDELDRVWSCYLAIDY